MNADLIARLEAATEGSRELDAEIWCHLESSWKHEGNGIISRTRDYSDKTGRRTGGCYESLPCPTRYTTSLDAALTLIGEGVEYTISTLYGVAVADVGLNRDNPERGTRKDGNVPMALCIVALKARA